MQRHWNTHNLVEALDGGEVLEERRVGDLAGSPLALVCGVVDHGGVPLALVSGVGLVGALPLATAGSLVALGVANGRGDPLAVLLVIPLLRLLSVYDVICLSTLRSHCENVKLTRVRNELRLVIEPALGLNGLLIGDLVRSLLVPVLGLLTEIRLNAPTNKLLN